jgi:hypothetical protein
MMTKEEARLLLMDYLYGELDTEKEKELMFFVEQHDDLKQEFAELSDTQSFLHHLPVQDPDEQLVIMEPNNDEKPSIWEQFIALISPQSGFARFSYGMASLALVFIITGAITGLNITYNDSGMQIGFGEVAPAQQTFTAEQVQMIVQQVQRDNVALVQQIVADAQEQQNMQLEATFASFADYLESQRTTDLKLISSGLADLEETTYDRIKQNEQVLGEIIQTVSLRNK